MFDGPKTKFDPFSIYITMLEEMEAPANYNRWCMISAIGACLGRQVFIKHSMFRIFPNLYMILVGEPAARKSTSIKIIKKLLRKAGYETFAADKTRKEKFLMDLSGFVDPKETGYKIKVKDPQYDSVTSTNLWGSDSEDKDIKQVYICSDELAEFTGFSNLDFYTTLGNLWDWDEEDTPFEERFKNSASISIYQPTINLLGGTTAELFSKIFPPEALGSGFLSRIVLIHGERSGRRNADPEEPSNILQEQLVAFFRQIQQVSGGVRNYSAGARLMLKNIYENYQELQDVRFKAYSNRRHTQLLKLCLIISLARGLEQIEEETVLEANTVLTHAEHLMPKALGEFGKSKNSEVTSKIMNKLEEATIPLSPAELWSYVRRDLEHQRNLMDILQGLLAAGKIQVISKPKIGYLPKKEIRKKDEYVNWQFLTQEERDMIGV